MIKFFTYLQESRAELKKVVWPSAKQGRDHTLVVIAVSLAVAAFLGSMDFILEEFVIKPFL